MTHDYTWHGTTRLFAALNPLDGRGTTPCMEFHRHQEWLKFRRLIDRLALASNQFRLIVDSYATHGHAVTQRWAARRRCVHFHFTPTSSG